MKQTKRTPRWTTSSLPSKFKYAGIHLIADFWRCKTIASAPELKRLLLEAASKSKSTVLKVSLHTFVPQGITGIVLLSESHIAVHTWPEIGYVALDIFTCGKHTRPKQALAYLKKALKPGKVNVREMRRGER